MMNEIIARYNMKKGQAMVEFALALPVFFLILASIIDIGFIMHSEVMISGAAREGARLSAVGNTDSYVKQQIIYYAPTLNIKSSDITISPADGSRTRGNIVTVTIKANSTVYFPVIQSILKLSQDSSGNGNYKVTGNSSMRVE